MYITLESSYSIRTKELPRSIGDNFKEYRLLLWTSLRRVPYVLGDISVPKNIDIKKLEESLNATI